MACREDARQVIKRVMSCSDKDAVIFSGSGSASARNLLIAKLKVKERSEFAKLWQAASFIPSENLHQFLAESMSLGLNAKKYCKRTA